MKMMDCVEVMVEKDSYAKEGVHKGMQGVVWEKEPKDGCWVVLFPQCGDKEDIAEKEADQTKSFAEKLDDLSNYRI